MVGGLSWLLKDGLDEIFSFDIFNNRAPLELNTLDKTVALFDAEVELFEIFLKTGNGGFMRLVELLSSFSTSGSVFFSTTAVNSGTSAKQSTILDSIDDFSYGN